MAFSHGKSAVFKVTDAGATLRDISAYLSSGGLARKGDLAETSTFGATYKTFVGGLLDGSIPIEGLFDPTVDGYLTGIFMVSKACEYFPQGNTSTMVKEAFNAILMSYEISTSVDGPASFSGEFQLDGAVTRTIV